VRILFTAAPEIGHIAPILGVATAARDAGHDVAIATHASRHALVTDAGLDPLPAGLATKEINAERLRRWPETRSQPATKWGVRMWVQIAAPAMTRDLLAVIPQWQPDVIVHDEGDYGGPVAAAKAGLPWITHGWGSPLRSPSDLHLLETELELAGTWAEHELETPAFGGLYTHALIDPCPALLDPDRAPLVPTWPIRPTSLGDDSRPRPAPRARNTCYIGFGTVPTFANATHDIIAAAEAASSAGLRPVATTTDPSLAERLAHLGVETHEFVALPDLLPRCAVVMTHGGAGTTLAALSHGIPVIVIPQGSPSQERMAAAVERAQVGHSVRTPSQITAAVRDALSDRIIQRAADAATAIQTRPRPQSIIPTLEALVAGPP
jgi:UDP:flavonoid glycosyltransferase YjiC (YdhE family)